jgi:hypothetical protein
MSNLNRKRHVVVLSDTAWEKYTSPVDGHIMIGTIQRGDHIGALSVRDGRHFCIIDGLCEPLVERKIEQGVHHATVA